MKTRPCKDCKEEITKANGVKRKNLPSYETRCRTCLNKYAKKYNDRRKKILEKNKWF
tara:strand:+ start:4101 stop:4271 length:171 start_codon:yes stop_codon:yes gene_type:complete